MLRRGKSSWLCGALSAILILPILTACSQPFPSDLGALPTNDKTGAGAPAPAGAPAGEVLLEKGDKIRVVVFNEPQLSGEFVVDAAGRVSYPLIGQVDVAGATAHEVEQRLTKRL